MADEQYEKYSKMLHHLEEGVKLAEELLVKTGAHPIGIEDWTQQIQIINEAIDDGQGDLVSRGNVLIEKLQRLKPID